MSDESTPSEIPIRRITSVEMRQRFNDGQYWDKVKSGELTEHVMETRLSKSLPNETLEIQSQMLSYRNSTGMEVARVHQYLRSNGTIAASGKPDPKRLFEEGVLYRLEKKGTT
jgi:hypothetical protein